MKRSKGFTLIELLAVIVILAIIALIATPMVLRYIENARKGANESSVNTIIRAADNYYASAMLNKDIELPKTFSFPDPNNELGIKGRQPDSGYLTINADGKTSLDIIYDGVSYSKLENETSISKNNMVIGDATTWVTNGNGTIIKYYNDASALNAQVNLQINMFGGYLDITLNYAVGTQSTNFPGTEIDFSKTLSENIEIFEGKGLIDQSGLPEVLNIEIDKLIEIFNNKTGLGLADVKAEIGKYASLLTNVVDFATVTNYGSVMSNVTDTTAYRLILEAVSSGRKIIVPNYVKHENGKLEKITEIGEVAFVFGSASSIRCEIAPLNGIDKGADVVISGGIETIGQSAFSLCFLNSVSLPNSLKTIGKSVFTGNRIKSLTLPKSLETIGDSAFESAGIRGNLIIPSSVSTIGSKAFGTAKCNPADGDEAYNNCVTLDIHNDITGITIEGDATRFNDNWTDIGFPESLKPSA